MTPLAPETHPEIARVKLDLGEVALAAGDPTKAAQSFAAAIASQTAWAGDPETVLRARFGRARALSAMGGDRAQARREAEEVLKLASDKAVALPELRTTTVARWLGSMWERIRGRSRARSRLRRLAARAFFARRDGAIAAT